jgi:predicted Zn-dependent peptidase
MIIDAVFQSKELEKEQKVVYEENLQNENDPDSLLQDGMDMILFEGTPYAKPIDYIHRPFDRKRVVEYYQAHYTPEKMALSIVSSASYKVVKGVVEQCALSRFRRKDTHDSGKEVEESELNAHGKKGEMIGNHGIDIVNYHPHNKIEKYTCKNGIKLVYGKMKNDMTIHVAVGFRTCPWRDVQERERMKLIKTIFSRSLNGRLYNELRKKHGLSYSPIAVTEHYDVTGKFTLYVEIESSKLIHYQEGGKRKKGVLPILLELVRDFIEKGPTKSEWEIVKTSIHSEQSISMESIHKLAEYNGKNYWMSLHECENHKGAMEIPSSMAPYRTIWDKYVRDATIEDCRQTIAKYMVPSNMCVVLVGGALPSFRVVEKCLDTCLLSK